MSRRCLEPGGWTNADHEPVSPMRTFGGGRHGPRAMARIGITENVVSHSADQRLRTGQRRRRRLPGWSLPRSPSRWWPMAERRLARDPLADLLDNELPARDTEQPDAGAQASGPERVADSRAAGGTPSTGRITVQVSCELAEQAHWFERVEPGSVRGHTPYRHARPSRNQGVRRHRPRVGRAVPQR